MNQKPQYPFFSLKKRLSVVLKTNVNFAADWEIESCKRVEVKDQIQFQTQVPKLKMGSGMLKLAVVMNISIVIIIVIVITLFFSVKGWTRRLRHETAYRRLCQKSTER